jgi:hypothetical protein
VTSVKARFRQYIPAGLYILTLAGFFSLWHWQTAGRLPPAAVATFAAFSWMAIVYGDLFVRISPLPPTLTPSLTFRFLFGYFIVNTCLGALLLAPDVGVARGFLILVAGAVVVAVVRRGRPMPARDSGTVVPDLLCILVFGAAATLWCADALSPIVTEGANTIFRVWRDSFFHVRTISMFSQAHGVESLSDIKMAGMPLPFYHYASYLLPAAIVSLTGSSAFNAFAGFQLPFGVMLTGIAAFAFAASLWGLWAGLAAGCALLLLPDAYQQGFGSRILSYHFLQQVNLAGLYGVSCAAAAWIFILDGCRRGKYSSVILGYSFILLTLIYKAQIFVAIAFLAMIYPCLFFSGLRAGRRVLAAILFTAVFVFVVRLAQRSGSFPTLRLDFSSTSAYAEYIFRSYDPGFLRDFFASHVMHGRPKVWKLVFAGMILLSSFGLWGFASFAIFLRLGFSRLRATLAPAVLFFPLFIVFNYMTMALGLATDTTGTGSFVELLNRPVVWAYYGVVVWTAGAAYAYAFGDNPPRSLYARGFVALCALSCFAVPWLFGRNLQTFPARPGFGTFSEFNRFPTCLVNATHYIKAHSPKGDVIQDSTNDPLLLVGALAERQDFAADWALGKETKALQDRLDGLASFKAMTTEAGLNGFAVKSKLSWYLLRPETSVSWPMGVLQNAAFACDGYRVYRFPNRN